MHNAAVWNADRFVSETARLIGRPPDLADAAPHWGGLTTCRWTHPAHESFVPAMDAHFLAYHFGPRAHVGFQPDGSRPESIWCGSGTCSYMPANLPVSWNLLTGMNVINILIPNALVSEANEYARDERWNSAIQEPKVGFYSRNLERLSILVVQALGRKDEDSRLQAESLTQELCLEMVRPAENRWQIPRGVARLTPSQTKRSIDFMHASLQGRCHLRSLSAAAGVSPFHFAHAFRNSVGASPHEYLSRLRASAAELLLVQSSRPLAEIGESIGFHSPAGFTNFFTRWTGVSPSSYRQCFMGIRPVRRT